jgi:DNA-binding transcriptional ArsR family regulator
MAMPRPAADSSVYNAIACDTRRVLLDVLLEGEASVSDLVERLEVSQPAVSQHLSVLKAAGLVDERADGRFRFYRLRPEPLAEVVRWARTFWESRLDALGAVLDDMDDNTKRPRRKPT